MKPIVVGISGASGAPYARRLLQVLGRTDTPLHVVVTGPAREVIADELGIAKGTVESRLFRARAALMKKVKVYLGDLG